MYDTTSKRNPAHPLKIIIPFPVAEDRIVHTSLERVTEAEEELLLLLREDPAFTYTVLAEKLGVSRKTISARIQSLKQKGILQRVGSDTKGYWKINSSSGQSRMIKMLWMQKTSG